MCKNYKNKAKTNLKNELEIDIINSNLTELK